MTVYLGDCLDVLPQLAADSVDAVICDPPYGLGFMGKAWDKPIAPNEFPMRRTAALDAVNAGASRQGGRQRAGEDFARRQARDARSYASWCEQWAAECLRVLKPGGHLLAFGGTRTYHRLASGIEDAGFEVRDCIAWLYGSGFPKSLDVSKAIDKMHGVERLVVADPQAGRRNKTPRAMQPGGGERDASAVVTEPATPEAEQWEGWGTALKPAHEPIVLARKSPKGTVANNVLEHGTGALNIDGCRVEGEREPSEYSVNRWKPGATLNAEGGTWRQQGEDAPRVEGQLPSGRFPPNVALDPTSADALDEQTGVLTSGLFRGNRTSDKTRGVYGAFAGDPDREVETYGDSGGASRFFPVFRYEAKAGDDERPKVGDVVHPTVKPIAFVRWLVRLVTPPGGVVLDPFLGSGTTAQACIAEGFRCIGIEREEDYMALIEARLQRPIQTGLALGGIA